MIQITREKAHEGKKQMQVKCLQDDRLVSAPLVYYQTQSVLIVKVYVYFFNRRIALSCFINSARTIFFSKLAFWTPRGRRSL